MTTTFYLIYRLFWTMNLVSMPAAIFSGALWIAECYAGLALGLYFFQVWRLVEPPLRRPMPGRTVDVFVTTYNEDVSLLRGTLTACVAMDYPHATYVLDDGARDEVRRLAESLGVRYISRKERTHAKAGNINHALRQTDGEFVVILDADHVPYPHYLTRLIGYFDDPRTGFVQAPHTTYNLDNFMGRWKSATKSYWEDVRIFFEAVQLGKNRYGVACFCGSAAIFRRKAIEEVGLFATETITEDMHTGMRINAAGWKSIAVSEEMVIGLAPDDAATFANQRLRWGEGNLSVIAYDNPLTMKGLTLSGRINYLASMACWTMGPMRLILYLTPLAMLLSGVAPVAGMSFLYFTIVSCYLITVWTAVKTASNGCGQLLGIEMAMMASFHLHLQALWRALFRRRRQKFVVTQKRRAATPSGFRRMWPQATLVALSVVAITWATSRVVFGISSDYLGLGIGGGLALYHSWLALAVLSRATAKRSEGEQWRHPLSLAVEYATGDTMRSAISVEFNENGCCLLTWEPLRAGANLEIAFHSPFGTTVCHGRVDASKTLGRSRCFAYLSNILFEDSDVQQRERESDELRTLILRYAVPVITRAHRFEGAGSRTTPEQLSGEGDLPMPVSIDTNLPNMAVQKSVALTLDKRGFCATLETPCPVGDLVRVAVDTPLGPIVTEAEVRDVNTIRVGDNIIHQHKFRWSNAASIQPVLSRIKQWRSSLVRSLRDMRTRRQSPTRVAALQLAACLLIGITFLAYSKIYYGDRLLAAAVGQPMTPTQRAKVEVEMDRLMASPRASADRLLRIYEAAVAIDDNKRASDAALRLADAVANQRFSWMLTSARHLAKTSDTRAADAAFDRILDEHIEREFSLEKQAEVYVEAAHAAVAVNNPEKAVDRFLKANELTTTDPQQAEELLGLLIAGKQAKLAVQILGQMERTDEVLRRIVDVYEIADQAQEAVPELEELRRRHPDDANVVRRLAELAVAKRDFASGIKYYDILRNLTPNSQYANNKLAEAMLLSARQDVAAGRLENALSLFDKSFELQPPDNTLKAEYGGLLANSGRFDEAIAILEALDDAESKIQLAAVCEMQGDRSRALQILLDLEKSHTLDMEAQRRIARLLLANQQYSEAVERLVDLWNMEPDDPELQHQLIDAVAGSDHLNNTVQRAVLDIYHKYRDADFQMLDARGFERLGDALQHLEHFEETRTVLDKAISEYPDARRLRFHLAQTLGNLGRYDDAETQYRVLLDSHPSSLR